MEKPDRDRTLAAAKRALDARDYQNVVNLLTPFADAGEAEAQFILGYLYFTECECPPGAAYQRLVDAAEQGHAESCYYLATFPESAEFAPPISERERVELLIQAGELGSVRAQCALGAVYARGDWSGPKNDGEAVKWYTKAAQQGNAEAQYNLGWMFLKGEGVTPNSTEGIAWLTKAADQGNDEASRLLAQIHGEGLFGVPKDAERAWFWQQHLLKNNK